MQEQAVNQILFSFSIRWTKHQCKNMRENEVLKNEHIWAHVKNWEVVQEESSFSRSPQYSQKNVWSCMYFPPTANCIRYIKVAQVQIYSIHLTLRMLLILPWWMFTNYCFMPNLTFSAIVLPLVALSTKPGVGSDCCCAHRLYAHPLERKPTMQYRREAKMFHLKEGEKMVAK